MKMIRTVLAMGLMVVFLGFICVGCKKDEIKELDVSRAQSPEGTHARIQELRTLLTDAVEQKNLELVHDNMYYLEGLCRALSSKLEGEKKQQVDGILADLTKIAGEIDNSAGRGNQSATEANLQKLIQKLDVLEAEFKDGNN